MFADTPGRKVHRSHAHIEKLGRLPLRPQRCVLVNHRAVRPEISDSRIEAHGSRMIFHAFAAIGRRVRTGHSACVTTTDRVPTKAVLCKSPLSLPPASHFFSTPPSLIPAARKRNLPRQVLPAGADEAGFLLGWDGWGSGRIGGVCGLEKGNSGRPGPPLSGCAQRTEVADDARHFFGDLCGLGSPLATLTTSCLGPTHC